MTGFHIKIVKEYNGLLFSLMHKIIFVPLVMVFWQFGVFSRVTLTKMAAFSSRIKVEE